MTSIAVGILGAGNISDTHARAARSIPGAQVVAVYGQNRAKTEALAAAHDARPCHDFIEFLDHRPMDIVAIGSPSGLHAEQGIAAAARGIHVLVEKPLDISLERSDALIAAADRAGVKLGVFFQDRLKPDVVTMKALIEAGTIGRPVLGSGRVRWYRPPPYYGDSKWRGTFALDGGGALINQAIHTLDLLLHLFGPIASVHARAATRLHDIEVEDTLVATLEYENGAVGTFEASTAVFPGYPRRVDVTGSLGTLTLEHDSLIGIDLVEPAAAPSSAAAAEPTHQNVASATVSDATPHRRVFEDFIRAIRTNTTPACDGREGRRSVEAVQALYASARQGRPVTIKEGK